MEYHVYTISLALLSTVLVLFVFLKPKQSNLPPGPKPWPIIGHIHLLGDKPHQSVAKLAKIYGPIMSLKLGSMTTIVISSPEVAKEMFIKHDLALSGRKVHEGATIGNHHTRSMVWLPVCPKWRDLRKIAAIQLFTTQRLDLTHGLRQRKVEQLVNYVRECSDRGCAIDVGTAAFTTTLNLLSNTFFSSDMSSHDSTYSQEFKDLVWGMLEEGGRPNASDFFPLLRPLDLQGVMRRMKGYFFGLLDTFEKITNERLSDTRKSKDDVLDNLLKLVDKNELRLDDMKHLLLDLFSAGTDTTSSTLEWAMAELLRHPDKMKQAQNEINQIIGDDKSIQEADISKLPYLQAIVKETFRLHPPVPFLVPHKAEKDVQIYNYHIPKDSQIWVNVWSIGRDTSIWPNAESFSPERFLGSETDIKGQNFELIPFGAGRRICPGLPLAYRMLHLMLATLLQSFNWEIADGVKPEDLDMDEVFGITLQRAKHLKAIPHPK